jgi:26S proteasome regulatory subunit N2
MGLALSLRRLDLIEMIFITSRSPASKSLPDGGPERDESLLIYVLTEIIGGTSGNEAWGLGFVDNVRLANGRRMMLPAHIHQLFVLLLKLFKMNSTRDWASITTIWCQHQDSTDCGKELVELVQSNKPDSIIEAYQIAFDIREMASQNFLKRVRNVLNDSGWPIMGTAEAVSLRVSQPVKTA